MTASGLSVMSWACRIATSGEAAVRVIMNASIRANRVKGKRVLFSVHTAVQLTIKDDHVLFICYRRHDLFGSSFLWLMLIVQIFAYCWNSIDLLISFPASQLETHVLLLYCDTLALFHLNPICSNVFWVLLHMGLADPLKTKRKKDECIYPTRVYLISKIRLEWLWRKWND